MFTETLGEVLAHKLIALPETQKYIRYRDVWDLWDLSWLLQQGAEVNVLFRSDDDKRTTVTRQSSPLRILQEEIEKQGNVYHWA